MCVGGGSSFAACAARGTATGSGSSGGSIVARASRRRPSARRSATPRPRAHGPQAVATRPTARLAWSTTDAITGTVTARPSERSKAEKSSNVQPTYARVNASDPRRSRPGSGSTSGHDFPVRATPLASCAAAGSGALSHCTTCFASPSTARRATPSSCSLAAAARRRARQRRARAAAAGQPRRRRRRPTPPATSSRRRSRGASKPTYPEEAKRAAASRRTSASSSSSTRTVASSTRRSRRRSVTASTRRRSQAARAFVFAPARQGGKPIRSSVQFTYEFHLPPSRSRRPPPCPPAAARPPARRPARSARPAPISRRSSSRSARSARRRRSSVRDREFQLRPIGSVQDILRVTPGLVLVQHSGGGKANQYFLRGFDADHGTDLALSIDGIPINMVSHAHGQGYATRTSSSPRSSSASRSRRARTSRNQGDFATAGAVNMVSRDDFEHSSLGFGVGGSPGHGALGYRGLLIASPKFESDVKATFAAEVGRQNGPFDNPEDWDKYKLFNKLTHPGQRRRSSLTIGEMSYGGAWHGSGQIPARAVERGQRLALRIDRSRRGRLHVRATSSSSSTSCARARTASSRRSRTSARTASTSSRTSRSSRATRRTATRSSRSIAARSTAGA